MSCNETSLKFPIEVNTQFPHTTKIAPALHNDIKEHIQNNG